MANNLEGDVSRECVLLLAERLWVSSETESKVKAAAEAVLLAWLERVGLPDANNQRIENNSGDVGNLGGVQLLAASVRGGDRACSLRQLKPGVLGECGHGSVPSKEGSDKSAGEATNLAGRRLSTRSKRSSQKRR